MITYRVFITGIDTGIGKTHFTVWLARELQKAGLKVGAYKPACSGVQPLSSDTAPVWEDAERLSDAIGRAGPIDSISPQRFLAPFAPPVAAALESREVDERLLVSAADWWNGRVDILLIEGAGGWLSPISSNWTNADLASQLGAPVLLVAGQRLGVINHSLLTIAAIERTKCPLLGVVMNEVSPPEATIRPGFDPQQSNIDAIEKHSKARVLGTLTHGGSPAFRPRDTRRSLGWEGLLKMDNCGV